MCRSRTTPFISLIISLLISCLGQPGCGRTVGRKAVKTPAPQPQATAESPVKVTQQNLSMAKDLKTLPSTEYVLGPEDELEITVFRRDEMKVATSIGPTGRIPYFLIGDIQAAGLTQFQLRDKVQDELAEFVKDPKVLVRVLKYRSHKIFVLGQMSKPGVYRITTGFTLLEAISQAGGITADAYLSGAYVVRDGKILLVNFFELIEKGNTDENIPLLAGDIIYIPSNKDQKVFVLGEVNKQSAIPIRDGLTLLAAIAEAGGFTRDARKDWIVVMRGNLSKPEIMKIDAEHFSPQVNIALQRGDIIYVASTSFANVERMALRLTHILQPFYTLTRTVVWGEAAKDVLEGGTSKFVVVE